MRRLFAGMAAALVIAVGSGACSDDDTAVPTTASTAAASTTTAAAPSTTAEVRLAREEYIRQGDDICAETDQRWNAIVRAQDRAPEDQQLSFEEQFDAEYRSLVGRFAALKPAAPDQPFADQLNALLQQGLAKEGERLAALKAGSDAVERLDGELQAIEDQISTRARQYGFVRCPLLFGGP